MSSDFPGGRLTIDLGALGDNWKTLNAIAPASECAAVVKANAYGIGIAEAVPALAAAGARTFFVAHLSEARIARAAAPDATVYVLNGLPPGACDAFAALGARPVLGSGAEISEWAAFAAATGADPAAAIHLDTGMTRLGLDPAEARDRLSAPDGFGFAPSLLMSHLAAADDPARPETERQRALFADLAARAPHIPPSLANSAATLRGGDGMAGDLVRGDLAFALRRPGVALYGSNPIVGRPSPLRPVVRVETRIIQIRDVAPGTAVGYGGAAHVRRRTRLAIVSLGYADGVLRAAGSRDGAPGAVALAAGVPCPFVGRVSMDLIAVDVTDAAEAATARGCWIEVLGERFGVDALAKACGTIGYEILTSLGRRYERTYVG